MVVAAATLAAGLGAGAAAAGPAAAAGSPRPEGVAHATRAPGARASGQVAVAELLSRKIAAVKGRDGGIAVLVPTTMSLGGPDYTAARASPGSYDLEIDSQPGCHQANVCLLADFFAQHVGVAQRPASVLFGTPVTLHGGTHGAFANIQCGAACTPAEVDWVHAGTLYTIHANPTVNDRPNAPPGALRAALVAAANQAIAAGPR